MPVECVLGRVGGGLVNLARGWWWRLGRIGGAGGAVCVHGRGWVLVVVWGGGVYPWRGIAADGMRLRVDVGL